MPAPAPWRLRSLTLGVVLLSLPSLAGCLGQSDAGRLDDLEAEVQRLHLELAAVERSHRAFTNESRAHAQTMTDFAAVLGKLQKQQALDSNLSAVVDHFLHEIDPALQAAVDHGELAMAERVAASARPSVVKVKAFLPGGTVSTGTGWTWRPDLVVTAAHVVLRPADRLTVTTLDGRTLDATLVDGSGEQDTALLAVPGLALAPLPTGRSADLVVGQALVGIGHPQGYADWSVSLGHVTQPVDPDTGTRPRFSSSVPSAPGSSGGPVLDADGRVVAITIGVLWPEAPSVEDSEASSLHVHVSPLTATQEESVHVPYDAVAGLLEGWAPSG